MAGIIAGNAAGVFGWVWEAMVATGTLGSGSSMVPGRIFMFLGALTVLAGLAMALRGHVGRRPAYTWFALGLVAAYFQPIASALAFGWLALFTGRIYSSDKRSTALGVAAFAMAAVQAGLGVDWVWHHVYRNLGHLTVPSISAHVVQLLGWAVGLVSASVAFRARPRRSSVPIADAGPVRPVTL